MRIITFILLSLILSVNCLAEEKVLNVYSWATDLPDKILHDFEKETGIRINHMSYDSNETLLAKLRATHKMQFDIIEPSSFFLEIFRKNHLLQTLNTSDFPELKHLQPRFQPKQARFDFIPYFFGATGILVNDKYYDPTLINKWRDLWSPKYKDSLLLLNEQREVFSIALLALGLDPNTEDPAQVKQAYNYLLKLFPNIKLFNSDAQLPLYIDEDIAIGMMWNVDAAKAHDENPHLHFIYPKDGYVLYNDCFAITKGAPHPQNARKFLHYLLRPEIAAKISSSLNYGVTNATALDLLPKQIRNNMMIYPSREILEKGTLQLGIKEKSIKLYGQLWERLKLNH